MKKFYLNSALILIISVLIYAGFMCIPDYNYKYGISVKKGTYISLSPYLTEIIYAIGAEDNLLAVTSWSDFPEEAKKKPQVGSSFFISKEAIIALKPEIVFALKSHKSIIDDLKLLGIKIYYYKPETIKEIYKDIIDIGRIIKYDTKATSLVKKIKNDINSLKKPDKAKNILFVAHACPFVTINKNSFITCLIKKSGHESITGNIEGSKYGDYPKIALEYAVLKSPDIVIVPDEDSKKYLKPFLKNSKFIVPTPETTNILLRAGPRISKAVKFFFEL